jgi:hypothetical protein
MEQRSLLLKNFMTPEARERCKFFNLNINYIIKIKYSK